MMTQIAILTSSFPFPPGEQFLEPEIRYWADIPARIVVVPLTANGPQCRLPAGVALDLTVARSWTLVRKILSCVVAPVTRVFWREVVTAFGARKLNITTLRAILLAVARTALITRALRRLEANRGYIDLAYCYWSEVQAYAAVNAKRRGSIGRVVSRAHSIDVYAERRPGGYMPLKAQFLRSVDMVAAVSDHARARLVESGWVDPSRVLVSRLGVFVPAVGTEPSPANELRIVSVSTCVPVKRVDVIADAVAILAAAEPSIAIAWTHIGGGPLFDDLAHRVRGRLGRLTNVQVNLIGQVAHEAVSEFFAENQLDVLVSASEIEGVPVAIMEAMAAGIPAIAPDVGAVHELVGEGHGLLMPAMPSPSEVARSIRAFSAEAKGVAQRDAVRAVVLERFSAVDNFASFTDTVYQIAVSD